MNITVLLTPEVFADNTCFMLNMNFVCKLEITPVKYVLTLAMPATQLKKRIF